MSLPLTTDPNHIMTNIGKRKTDISACQKRFGYSVLLFLSWFIKRGANSMWYQGSASLKFLTWKKFVLYQAVVIPAVNSCHTTLWFGNGNQHQNHWFVITQQLAITSFKTQRFFLAEEKFFCSLGRLLVLGFFDCRHTSGKSFTFVHTPNLNSFKHLLFPFNFKLLFLEFNSESRLYFQCIFTKLSQLTSVSKPGNCNFDVLKTNLF